MESVLIVGSHIIIVYYVKGPFNLRQIMYKIFNWIEIRIRWNLSKVRFNLIQFENVNRLNRTLIIINYSRT